MRAAKLNAVGWTAVFALCLGGMAHAQTSSDHWTVDSAQTVGSGANVVRGQVGFPGLWGDIVHGIDPTTEIGGRLQINYGIEGLTDSTNFEMGLQFLARKQFVDTGKFKFAATFNPGFLFWTGYSTTTFGITFPIEAQFGIPIDQKFTLNASFGLPMWVTFGDLGLFYLPILFGAGVEYLLEPNIALTFKLRVGPTIAFGHGTSASSFTLNALVGVAYKF
ncbi:MAG TPA: hypothetical protein VMH40_06185 [Myxococcaceae bacterium]|nr:hypothetical protein [Myxococcaceae bacterium]